MSSDKPPAIQIPLPRSTALIWLVALLLGPGGAALMGALDPHALSALGKTLDAAGPYAAAAVLGVVMLLTTRETQARCERTCDALRKEFADERLARVADLERQRQVLVELNSATITGNLKVAVALEALADKIP